MKLNLSRWARQKKHAYEVATAHFNTAVEATGHTARLLASVTSARPWVLDMNPFAIDTQYTGKKKGRLTRKQRETNMPQGRVKRVMTRGPA